jgi:hypothetical protein
MTAERAKKTHQNGTTSATTHEKYDTAVRPKDPKDDTMA